jgi:hypothetical protein
VLFVGLVAAVFWSNATTTAFDSAAYVYDGPVAAHIGASPNAAAETDPAQQSDGWEASASPSVAAGASSTTFAGSVVATEAADHVVLGKSIGLEEQAAKIGGRHVTVIHFRETRSMIPTHISTLRTVRTGTHPSTTVGSVATRPTPAMPS